MVDAKLIIANAIPTSAAHWKYTKTGLLFDLAAHFQATGKQIDVKLGNLMRGCEIKRQCERRNICDERLNEEGQTPQIGV